MKTKVEVLVGNQTPSFNGDALAPVLEVVRLSGLQLDLVNGPWIAGSAAAVAYFGPEPADVDVFFANTDQLQAAREELLVSGFTPGLITQHGEQWLLSASLRGARKLLPINLIVSRFCQNLDELFRHFDMHHCQAATDGHAVIITDEALESLGTRKIRFNQAPECYTDSVAAVLRRVGKYCAKGFKCSDAEYVALLTRYADDKAALTYQRPMTGDGSVSYS